MSSTPAAAANVAVDQLSIDDPLIFTPAVCADLNMTDRALRNWIAKGKFAPPDANISGQNAWLTSTYRREKAAILAGRFRQVRRPLSLIREKPAPARS